MLHDKPESRNERLQFDMDNKEDVPVQKSLWPVFPFFEMIKRPKKNRRLSAYGFNAAVSKFTCFIEIIMVGLAFNMHESVCDIYFNAFHSFNMQTLPKHCRRARVSVCRVDRSVVK